MARGCGEDEAGRWRTAAERGRVGAQQRAAETARMAAATLEKACAEEAVRRARATALRVEAGRFFSRRGQP